MGFKGYQKPEMQDWQTYAERQRVFEASQEQEMQKPRPGDKFDILNTNILNFPLRHLDYKDEFLEDILKPITIQKDEILKDIYQYRKEFPY